jgi:hypothetical protein
MANCARRVLKYLKGTASAGIGYSPEEEADFTRTYQEMENHADNLGQVNSKLIEAPVHTFTDASFGVAYKTMRSISGVVIYLHGVPVAWRSKVQTVFASSTTESEWIALSEGVEMETSVIGLQEFLMGKSQDAGPLWCDNRGAVVCARKGPDGTDEIPKRTRHVALRFAKVLPQCRRLWFCPTNHQLADGLTKSTNSGSLKKLLHCDSGFPIDEIEDGDEDLDLRSHYVNMM